jgi:hypothetical protein
MMFVVTFNLDDVGTYKTLEEAIGVFVGLVFEHIRSMSLQALETACWVSKAKCGGVPLYGFYDARDLAIDEGWMEDGTGKWLGVEVDIPKLPF